MTWRDVPIRRFDRASYDPKTKTLHAVEMKSARTSATQKKNSRRIKPAAKKIFDPKAQFEDSLDNTEQSRDMQISHYPDSFDVPRFKTQDIENVKATWKICDFDAMGKQIAGHERYDFSKAVNYWKLYACDYED